MHQLSVAHVEQARVLQTNILKIKESNQRRTKLVLLQLEPVEQLKSLSN